jgi:glycosyltransferase involved in cell wall biosynthesis
MKIMFLSGSYWPAQDGVAHVTEYLAEGLAKKHEILMLTPFGKSKIASETYNGVQIERITAKRKFSCNVVGDKATMFKRIDEYNPDVLVVIGIQNWGFDWTKGKLDRLPGRKVLMTHGSSCVGEYHVWNKVKQIRLRRQILADLLCVYMEWYWKRYRKSFPKYMAKYDLVTYLFDKEPLYLYLRKFFGENTASGNTAPHRISPKKEIILENATEDIFFERKAYLVDCNKPIVFINVSNYEDRKNQKLILEAFYSADIPESQLVLIGSKANEYYNEISILNKQYFENTHRCGRAELLVGISREEVLERYKEADVYISASKWEAMSISLCEAAAAGLTILTTDVGHASSIPGCRFFSTAQELAALMQDIYEQPSLREESGRKAYEYAEKNYRIQSKVDYLEQELLCLVENDLNGQGQFGQKGKFE